MTLTSGNNLAETRGVFRKAAVMSRLEANNGDMTSPMLDVSTRPGAGHVLIAADYSEIDVEVRIDAEADAETLQGIHERVVATSPVGQTLAAPVPVNVRLAP